MSGPSDTQTAELGPGLARLVAPWLEDEFVERHIRWRQEATAVSWAYEDWQAAEAPDEPIAFAAYQAALDREEQAAAVLHEAVERFSPPRT
jgi:hypothetical protein